jgi:hypothetical protein
MVESIETANGATLRFTESGAVKEQDPERAHLEYIRTQAGAAIGDETGSSRCLASSSATLRRASSASSGFAMPRRAGLKIAERYPLGILPLTDKRMPRPTLPVKTAERLLSRFAPLSSLAQDVIYLCRKR